MLPYEIDCESESDLLRWASSLASIIKSPKIYARILTQAQGLVVFLQGDLGAGKTTLVRGFLRALGETGKVKSPTYALVEPYLFAWGSVFHFDLYRINDQEELHYLGLDDYFKPGHIVLIEWPERADTHLPRASITIKIHFTNHQQRRLEIISGDELGDAILAQLPL